MKKIETLKVDAKTANLENLQNFDVIEETHAGFRISDPTSRKFDQFQTKYILAVEQCYAFTKCAESRIFKLRPVLIYALCFS